MLKTGNKSDKKKRRVQEENVYAIDSFPSQQQENYHIKQLTLRRNILQLTIPEDPLQATIRQLRDSLLPQLNPQCELFDPLSLLVGQLEYPTNLVTPTDLSEHEPIETSKKNKRKAKKNKSHATMAFTKDHRVFAQINELFHQLEQMQRALEQAITEKYDLIICRQIRFEQILSQQKKPEERHGIYLYKKEEGIAAVAVHAKNDYHSISLSEISDIKDFSALTPENRGETIKLITSQCKFTRIDEKRDGLYQTIHDALLAISNNYQAFQERMINATFEERYQLIEKMPRLRSASMGDYNLNPSVLRRFPQACFKGNAAHQQTALEIERYQGSHTVIRIGNLFLKSRPDSPAVEQAVDALNKILSGQGFAPTELLVFESNGIPCPIQVSLAVDGEDFEEVLCKEQERVMHDLDSYDFTKHALLCILTNPLDNKPDNFKALISAENKKIFLVGIDNDLAFGIPISYSEIFKKHYVEIKNLFYTFPQMEQPIDSHFRAEFLKRIPEAVMLEWLKVLLIQQTLFKQYEAILTEKELNEIGIPLKFIPGTTATIYKKLKLLHQLMRENPQVTHHALLAKIDKIVGHYYQAIRQNELSLAERIQFIYDSPDLREMLPAKFHERLSEYTMDVKTSRQLKTQMVEEACSEWLTALDFSEIPHQSTQLTMLKQIVSNFSCIKAITINHCQALDDEVLMALAREFTKIEYLTLHGCLSVKGHALAAVLHYHPNAAIHLITFPQISGEDLFMVALHCHRFELTLENGQTYVVSPTNGALFDAALKENSANLLQFLLAYGEDFLHIAIKQQALVAVETLINYGATVDKKDVNGQTPLDVCISQLEQTSSKQEKNTTLTIISLLIKAGAIDCQKIDVLLTHGIKYLRAHPQDHLLAEKMFSLSRRYNHFNQRNLKYLINVGVKELDLSITGDYQYSYFNLDVDFIAALFKHAPQLIRLDLTGCKGLNQQTLDALAQSPLKQLCLDSNQAEDCGLFSNDNFAAINQLSHQSIQILLKKLELGKITLTPDMGKALKALLTENETINHLSIWRSDISCDAMRQLCDGMANSASLTKLEFKNNIINSEALITFAEMLREHTRIEVVYFNNNGISAQEAPFFADILKNNATLKDLSLYRNALTDNGVAKIVYALQSNKSLETLSLEETNMTDKGARELAQVLIKNKTLRWLDISKNGLSDIGIQYLLDMLTINMTLQELHYREITLSDPQHRALKFWEQSMQERCRYEKWEQLKTPNQYYIAPPVRSPNLAAPDGFFTKKRSHTTKKQTAKRKTKPSNNLKLLLDDTSHKIHTTKKQASIQLHPGTTKMIKHVAVNNKIQAMLDFIGEKDNDTKPLGEYIIITRREIAHSICNPDNYYTNDLIDLLLYPYNSSSHAIKAYPAKTPEQLQDEYLASIQSQNETYAFIPLNVAYNKADLLHNHWAALIIDKERQLIFYLDPAKKSMPDQISTLKNMLGYLATSIQSSIDFQRAEKSAGWLRHCGAYVIEMFEIFAQCIRANNIISGSALPNLDIEGSISLQTALSGIPCGAAENIVQIRKKHIDQAYRILMGLGGLDDTESSSESEKILVQTLVHSRSDVSIKAKESSSPKKEPTYRTSKIRAMHWNANQNNNDSDEDKGKEAAQSFGPTP